MTTVSLTPEQHAAVTALGGDVIVRASAGSGKTTVLTQRCVFLICDAPPPYRCSVDQLLVLTFTDAAAAEMRSRITDALHARLAQEPHNRYLQEQVARAPVAQISTIHSYCLWLIRRWFSELGVDPGASIMDSEQAALLKRQVLEQVFADLYAESAPADEALLGVCEAAGREEDTRLTGRFVRLVDEYGLGEDRRIADYVRRLAGFLDSLPDPERWLDQAVDAYGSSPKETLCKLAEGCRQELLLQAEHCDRLGDVLYGFGAVTAPIAAAVSDYSGALAEWYQGLADGDSGDPAPDVLQRYERVRLAIASFELPTVRAPRKLRESDPAAADEWDRAKKIHKDVREKLLGKRLQKRFALFSVEERLADLRGVSWVAETIADLVRSLRTAYEARKRGLDVLDFADLERLAYELLADDGGQIAETLRDRFRHVLVDEFQDINPLQDAIIRRSSHESLSNRPGNLFVVGDIKQSIYRFRLAEPAVFAQRWARCQDDGDGAAALMLQTNFRSTPSILRAVNELFSRLMPTDGAAVTYDASSFFVAGRDEPDGATTTELHLFESHWPGVEEGEETATEAEVGVADRRGPAHWSPIEREAFWIAQRIHGMVGEERGASADESTDESADASVGYGDIVVLLRSAKVSAERVASMLAACGVPARAAVGGELLAAVEVRDVVSALQVLDNPLQDIPLAAVLRNRVFGDCLSEDELVEIRSIDRSAPFCEAVRAYAAGGGDEALRNRVAILLGRIEALRRESRHRPVFDVVASVQNRHGFFAYVGGLPNGVQRRANLSRFHELARSFGRQRRPQLRRFIEFLELLEDEGKQPSVAAPPAESEDVVRVLTIHQSKGLEFPVVFLAGLGSRFNLADSRGALLFERQTRIGLKVVDNERMIEYPTAAHARTVMETQRCDRDEELRVLYVAMTRARDRLILTGSRRSASAFLDDAAATASSSPPTALSVSMASMPLEWLVTAISSMSAAESSGVFEMFVHDQLEMDSWSPVQSSVTADVATLDAVAGGQRLPDGEPASSDMAAVDEMAARVSYRYPHLEVTSLRAAMGASEAKRPLYDALAVEAGERDAAVFSPSATDGPGQDEAMRRGVAMHRVLQRLDFAEAATPGGVSREVQRLLSSNELTQDDLAWVDEDALTWFVGTPLADRIRNAGDGFRREFQYIASERPEFLDPTIGPTQDDFVLIRGIVDGVLPDEDGLVLIDYKTDSVTAEQVPGRVERYTGQMKMYARAMSRMWRQPVRNVYLVFLAARSIVDVTDAVTEESDVQDNEQTPLTGDA